MNILILVKKLMWEKSIDESKICSSHEIEIKGIYMNTLVRKK